MDDPDLPFVRALQGGNDDALNMLMARHKEALVGFVSRLIPCLEDAEEVAQETFVRAYFRIQSFEPRAKFKTWLFRIAHNLCIDYLRSSRFRQENLEMIPPFEPTQRTESPSLINNPAETSQMREQLRAVEQAIQELPSELRVPLLLSSFDGFSYNEIAAILKTSTKSVEMKIYRARKALTGQTKKRGF